MGAYYSRVRPKVSAHQWAVARLKAHAKGKATVKKADSDLFRRKTMAVRDDQAFAQALAFMFKPSAAGAQQMRGIMEKIKNNS